MKSYKVLLVSDSGEMWLNMKAENMLRVIKMIEAGFLTDDSDIKSVLIDEVKE